MDTLLLKVPEAAAQLAISRAKLDELVAAGLCPLSRSVAAGGSGRWTCRQDYVNR